MTDFLALLVLASLSFLATIASGAMGGVLDPIAPPLHILASSFATTSGAIGGVLDTMAPSTLQILALSFATIASGAMGGVLEPWAPQTQFPESWMTQGVRLLEDFNWQNRLVTGMLCGMFFLARFCGFASCDLISDSSVPTMTVATFVMAVVSGMIGARMVRMRISVPLEIVWDFMLNVLKDALVKRFAKKRSKGKGKKTK